MPGYALSAEGPTGPPARGAPGLGSALLPVPARLAMGFQSWGDVQGNPSSTPTPAPYPAGVPQGQVIGACGSTDATSTSKDAPPFWTPAVYYQRHLPDRFPGAISSDNQMPVPARLPNGQFGFVATGNERPFLAARVPRYTRQRQVRWPITLPNYSNWAGT